ncbi:MAG: serine hydroxymethyltransferase, partial [Planctomycetota bacterium]
IDLRATDPELTGKVAAGWLEDAGIIANMNTVPNETRSPFQTSGIRIGTPALTTRGLTEDDFADVADFIDQALRSAGDEAKLQAVRDKVADFATSFAMPH